MANVTCESKLRSVVGSSMYPCPGNRVAVGRVVVLYAWSSHASSAGIECRNCSVDILANIKYLIVQQYHIHESIFRGHKKTGLKQNKHESEACV